jgi:RimJ/RimL family protein N-acetyltransferase
VAEWQERLPGGERIVLRSIRPEDREKLALGMARLSPESRYRRFFSATTSLSEAELDYLTRVDHHDHEALVALDTATEEGIGVARFVRSESEPDVAELAVAVVDPWQGRGVGRALLHRITERARDEGIGRYSAWILAENRPMLELIDDLGDMRVKGREAGAVEVEVELPDDGIGAATAALLRTAARGLLPVRPSLRA